MANTLDELRAQRPGDREAIDAHKAEMLAEVRAYRLRELRERLNMTQTEVGHVLKVSQKRISTIEHGDLEHVQVDTLRRYAEALGGTLSVELKVGDEAFQIA